MLFIRNCYLRVTVRQKVWHGVRVGAFWIHDAVSWIAYNRTGAASGQCGEVPPIWNEPYMDRFNLVKLEHSRVLRPYSLLRYHRCSTRRGGDVSVGGGLEDLREVRKTTHDPKSIGQGNCSRK
jgi:hypothetical protein